MVTLVLETRHQVVSFYARRMLLGASNSLCLGGEMSGVAGNELQWPALPWGEWEATANTLHMWTQIVGKTRLALTPLQNHWWNVPLYVTAHGLGTSAMVCGDDVLDIEFDFLAHVLHFRQGSGKEHTLPLRAQTVAG